MSAPANEGEKKRVLVVDDQPEIVKIFVLTLKLAGYDAIPATTGAEAVELVRTQTIDVMILDALMPSVSGLQVLEQVRAFSQMPIVLCSARDDISSIAKDCGVEDYISKPIHPDDLVEKIEAVLQRAG